MNSHLNSAIIVMGVSGSGKSLVGEHLASSIHQIKGQRVEMVFVDGDDLHPVENVELMRAGIKLDDQTRKPWLDSICKCAESHFAENRSLVVACSALKKRYRQRLRNISGAVYFVFLSGPEKVIGQRIQAREGHFMPSSLLETQFADLEDPTGEPGVVEIDIDQTKAEVLTEALKKVRALIQNQ